jgi:hypothetical protein
LSICSICLCSPWNVLLEEQWHSFFRINFCFCWKKIISYHMLSAGIFLNMKTVWLQSFIVAFSLSSKFYVSCLIYILSLSFKKIIWLQFPLVSLEIWNHQIELNWCLFSGSTSILLLDYVVASVVFMNSDKLLCGLATWNCVPDFACIVICLFPRHTDCTTVSCYLDFCLITY